jgi:hypothetical protein
VAAQGADEIHASKLDVNRVVRQSANRGVATAPEEACAAVADESAAAKFVSRIPAEPTGQISPFKDRDQQLHGTLVVRGAEPMNHRVEPMRVGLVGGQLTAAASNEELPYSPVRFEEGKCSGTLQAHAWFGNQVQQYGNGLMNLQKGNQLDPELFQAGRKTRHSIQQIADS